MEQINYGQIKIKFEGVTINPHFWTETPTLTVQLDCHMHHWDIVTQWYEKQEFPITWDGMSVYINGIEVNRFTELPYNERFCILIEVVYTHRGHIGELIITTEASTVPRRRTVRTYDTHRPTSAQINVREYKGPQ